MDTYQIVLTFTEPLLGTVPLNEEVYKDYIQSKRPDGPEGIEDELETLTVDEEMEKGTTGFHRIDGVPILYDYVIKGFFKDACGMLRRTSDSASAKLPAYRKVIDGLVFAKPRQIPISVNGAEFMLERPLRAQTAQGERVALARSEALPIGSSLEFTILVLGTVKQSLLEEWLTYGALRGLGQWRSASYGSFVYQIKHLTA